MKKPLTILGILMLCLSVYALFQVKYKVQHLKRELAEINRQLARENQQIHILKAEWAYLNNPYRVDMLTKKYLSLDYIESAQMESIEALPTYHASIEPIHAIPKFKPSYSEGR